MGLFALLIVIAALAASPAEAQQPNQAHCRAYAVERRFMTQSQSGDACFIVANAIVTDLSAKAWLEPRDVQSSGAGNAAPAGTPAQTSAVPTIQPTAFAAAALAAVAQDSGADVITSMSINPLMLFSSSNDPDVLARLSRVMDFTVFFPLDGFDQDDDGRLDYAGARARVNFTSAKQASALQRIVRQRLTRIVRNELTMANQVHAVLLAAPEPAACAQVLVKDDAATDDIVASCGEAVSTRVDDRDHIALRRAAAAAREEADARYLGLDLRLDVGDPSLGRVRKGAATALQGGVGFGRRFNPASAGATAGFRGRLGGRYVTLRDTALSDFQLDGGVAFEASRVVGVQRLELSAGIEFRYSGKEDDAEILRTRYAEFRAGINLPIAGSAGISMSASTPLTGEISPTLVFNGNWQQLLAALIGR
jgi:hypothetical protein